MIDTLPRAAEALRTATDTDLIHAWTAAVGEKPACLLDRDTMIGILCETMGLAGLDRAVAALPGGRGSRAAGAPRASRLRGSRGSRSG